MHIRTPVEFGLVMRDRRRRLKLNQAELARTVGVGRQWIVGIERGKSRAEFGLALRTRSAFGLSLTIGAGVGRPGSRGGLAPADIDAVVNSARETRK